MSNLYVASEYKNKIINLLFKSDNFIALMNPQESPHPDLDVIDVLTGGEWIIDGTKYTLQGHVFDYNFVNETTDEQKTFLFVETDIENIKDNMFTDFNLHICIFTSKNLVRLNRSSVPTVKQVKEMGYFATTSNGNRIDALCDCVDRILNGTDKLVGIGNVEPSPRNHMSVYIPNSNYYGKHLKYHIRNYNPGGDECGI